MKFLHTSDIHLDTSFAAEGLPLAAAQARREALRAVFSSILQRAKEWPADAVLIAGDLFDQERVTRETVLFLQELFESIAPLPVFITPGNRDPYVPESPYALESWPGHVHIFPRPEWDAVKLDNLPLTVFGFGFDGPTPSRNPFGALHVPDDGRVHLAVGHGSEETCRPKGKAVCASFAAENASPPGLHYLGLGHYHQTIAVRGAQGARVYYSGAPDALGFSDEGPRRCLEVEVDYHEDTVRRLRVTPCPSAHTEYLDETVDCSELADGLALENAVSRVLKDGPLSTMLRLRLTGAASSSVRAALPSLASHLAEGVAYLDLRDDTAPNAWLNYQDTKDTSLGVFAAQMQQQIQDAPDQRLRRMLTRAAALGFEAYHGKVPSLDDRERGAS